MYNFSIGINAIRVIYELHDTRDFVYCDVRHQTSSVRCCLVKVQSEPHKHVTCNGKQSIILLPSVYVVL